MLDLQSLSLAAVVCTAGRGVGDLPQPLSTPWMTELGWGWPPKGHIRGASLWLVGVRARNHADEHQRREDAGLHPCPCAGITAPAPASPPRPRAG